MPAENKIIEVVEKVEEGNDSQITVDDLFDELFKLQLQGHYFFRGISKHDQFFSSLHRYYIENDLSNKNILINDCEYKLLKEYSKYSISFLPNITHFLDWVSSAQHYGLPTRLIDWTKNPFTALFFSLFYNSKNKIEKNEDEFYRLLIIDAESHLYFNDVPPVALENKNSYIDSNTYIVHFMNLISAISGDTFPKNYYGDKFENEFMNKIHEISNEKLFLCSINNSNPRIIAQEGLFQIPKLIDLNSKNFNNDYSEKYADQFYKIVKIQKGVRNKILQSLEIMNINTIKLFPDLQNICEYIKRTTWVDEETI